MPVAQRTPLPYAFIGLAVGCLLGTVIASIFGTQREISAGETSAKFFNGASSVPLDVRERAEAVHLRQRGTPSDRTVPGMRSSRIGLRGVFLGARHAPPSARGEKVVVGFSYERISKRAAAGCPHTCLQQLQLEVTVHKPAHANRRSVRPDRYLLRRQDG